MLDFINYFFKSKNEDIVLIDIVSIIFDKFLCCETLYSLSTICGDLESHQIGFKVIKSTTISYKGK